MDGGKNGEYDSGFSEEVGRKEKRKIKARRNKERGIWASLGMYGLVGWSVATPTFLGAVFGRWLDARYQQNFSWTLTLMIIGLLLGCWNAWHWINKEHEEIHREEEDSE